MFFCFALVYFTIRKYRSAVTSRGLRFFPFVLGPESSPGGRVQEFLRLNTLSPPFSFLFPSIRRVSPNGSPWPLRSREFLSFQCGARDQAMIALSDNPRLPCPFFRTDPLAIISFRISSLRAVRSCGCSLGETYATRCITHVVLYFVHPSQESMVLFTMLFFFLFFHLRRRRSSFPCSSAPFSLCVSRHPFVQSFFPVPPELETLDEFFCFVL